MYITMKDGRKVYMPTDEEDAQITAAALSDPDCPPLTDEQLANMRPASEVLPPKLFSALVDMSKKAGRPLVNGIAKKPVTLRIDEDLVDQLRASGKGWQTRLNAQIRQWVNEETKDSNFAH